MSIVLKLAHSPGIRYEVANHELAKKIVAANNKTAVQELVENPNNKTRDIQHDCIKVLYEIGVLKPTLISGYIPEFLRLLKSKNNRMQWGRMIAIDSITLQNTETVYEALGMIINASDKGSVITRDYAVSILIKLCSVKKYEADAFKLLVDQLKNCPANQLPMYAEHALPIVTGINKVLFCKNHQRPVNRYGNSLKNICKIKTAPNASGRLSIFIAF